MSYMNVTSKNITIMKSANRKNLDNNYVLHENEWWWGRSITIIHRKGISMIEIKFSNDNPKAAYLTNLSVFESNRNCGLATELLTIAEELIKLNGASLIRLDLDSSSDENWLLEWYKRKGFKIAGSKFYVTEMMKCLK